MVVEDVCAVVQPIVCSVDALFGCVCYLRKAGVDSTSNSNNINGTWLEMAHGGR